MHVAVLTGTVHLQYWLTGLHVQSPCCYPPPGYKKIALADLGKKQDLIKTAKKDHSFFFASIPTRGDGGKGSSVLNG